MAVKRKRRTTRNVLERINTLKMYVLKINENTYNNGRITFIVLFGGEYAVYDGDISVMYHAPGDGAEAQCGHRNNNNNYLGRINEKSSDLGSRRTRSLENLSTTLGTRAMVYYAIWTSLLSCIKYVFKSFRQCLSSSVLYNRDCSDVVCDIIDFSVQSHRFKKLHTKKQRLIYCLSSMDGGKSQSVRFNGYGAVKKSTFIIVV